MRFLDSLSVIVNFKPPIATTARAISIGLVNFGFETFTLLSLAFFFPRKLGKVIVIAHPALS
jgi:hypothetical protein